MIRLGAGAMAGPVDRASVSRGEPVHRTAPNDYDDSVRHDMVAPARHEGARPHQEEL
ncbi:hypothetical protein LT493_18305 [Streptomyces tricolor]|nr:hypothetical protein [Streptomyces tricolor]